MMKKVLLYIWQLPQNILGLLVVLFSRAKKDTVTWYTKYNFGVSLGNYIIITERCLLTDIWHELGHQKQSQYLGWFYLLVIGLPSALGNLYDQWFHNNWSEEDRIKWYYKQPWEAWADKLGGVER